MAQMFHVDQDLIDRRHCQQHSFNLPTVIVRCGASCLSPPPAVVIPAKVTSHLGSALESTKLILPVYFDEFDPPNWAVAACGV